MTSCGRNRFVLMALVPQETGSRYFFISLQFLRLCRPTSNDKYLFDKRGSNVQKVRPLSENSIKMFFRLIRALLLGQIFIYNVIYSIKYKVVTLL